jgi:hypothetical protein
MCIQMAVLKHMENPKARINRCNWVLFGVSKFFDDPFLRNAGE